MEQCSLYRKCQATWCQLRGLFNSHAPKLGSNASCKTAIGLYDQLNPTGHYKLDLSKAEERAILDHLRKDNELDEEARALTCLIGKLPYRVWELPLC